MTVLLVTVLLAGRAFARNETQPSNNEESVVVAEGVAAFTGDIAAAQDEAVQDAKRHAAEQVAGVLLRSRTLGRDFSLVQDEIRTRTDAYVRDCEILPDTRRIERVDEGGKLLHIKIRATVAMLAMIQRLSDIKEVYDDLERPRLLLQMESAGLPARNVLSALTSAFQQQGYEVVTGGPTELRLIGRLESRPTVRLGDREAPYGIGESVAVCRTRLRLRVESVASEEALLEAQADGVGQSFQSDADAASEAATNAVEALLQENDNLFTQRLLVRWARERQEGHTVVVQATGLTPHLRAVLKEAISDMRGSQEITAESVQGNRYTLRFITRLETRLVRSRLASLRLERQPPLVVLNDRGPIIACATSARSPISRR